MHPVIILIVIVGVLLAVSWLRRQPRAVRSAAGWKMALSVLGVMALLGVITGRLNPATLLVTVAAAVPLLSRVLDAKQLFDRIRSASGPSAGQTSSVSTQFLEMTLEHDSGRMHGQVVAGRFAGRSLDELSHDELVQLLEECATDPQSAKLLESYLDRVIGESWRDAYGGGTRGAGAEAAMNVDEAREILGVSDGATREEIVAAHRSLMQKLHPDRGGSTYLAAKVNQAKELLLSSL